MIKRDQKPKVRGVRYVCVNGTEYWQMSISNQGFVERKFYSVKKFGYDTAYDLACKYRKIFEEQYRGLNK